jgi:predicted membrane protein
MLKWIWASVILQALGYAFDAVWHGVLNPGVEPTTVSEMVRHLATVHVPLYVGALSLLASTFVTLARQRGRSATGLALPAAFIGAVVSVAAEAWHAYSHLRLDTHSGPIAGTLSFVGFLVVLGAMSVFVRRRRQPDATASTRRAA